MAGVVDYSDRYSNDSEALDRWIADCFMDPQPSYYYCKPISAAAPTRDALSLNDVIIPHKEEKGKKLDDVIIPHKEEKGKKMVKFDPVSALEETKRFVSELLGTGKTKKIDVSTVDYGVPKLSNPKQQSLGHKKQAVCDSRFKASSKRKFNDSDVKDVKKQKIILGPEQPRCMGKPIGKPERFLVSGTHKKCNFQPLVC